jgi:hypothetical protein
MPADDQCGGSVDLLGQLRAAVDQLNAVATRVPGVTQVTAHVPSLPSLPTFPAPGKITAVQISAVVGSVRAMRSNIQTLRISLDAFEQQLDVLERLLEPFESLTQTWAQVEAKVTGEHMKPGDEVPGAEGGGR